MDLHTRNSTITPNSHSSHTTFPFIAIAIIGIIATALLLLSYYIFVIKCCFNWRRIHLFSHTQEEHPLTATTFYSPPTQNRGLDQYTIQSIPISQFKKPENQSEKLELCECAVCLNEFQEEERLRIIPNCTHMFHIDCIDVWLQRNSNCPICRTSISRTTLFPLYPSDTINPNSDSDFIVIELGEENNEDGSLLTVQERLDSSRLTENLEQGKKKRKDRKIGHVLSMGDECIDIGLKKDEEFEIQPIRRSFSMDSAADRQLYLAVQEIVQHKRFENEDCSSSSSNRICRSFFSFGHGRGSRSAVLPTHLEQ